ncbi:MAG: NAD-dependent epimerase/dehydratase family protein [Cytophagales bacterium]|nr:MAG: NAD-dependent epimerase/dehydratase family protein [Cytophagales bacterium]
MSSQVPELPQVDMVIHSAGMAHIIPKSEAERNAFFLVNVQGTKNLLEALNALPSLPKSFILISTVAVYGKEVGEEIKESHPLEGDTPYAKSKILAEKLVKDWGKKNGVDVVILRLPLVIGSKSPKGNLATMISGIRSGFYFRPGLGKARRSMVLAGDVVELTFRLWGVSGTFNLTDGRHPSFAELDSALGKAFDKRIKQIPESLLLMMAKLGDLIPKFPINSLKMSKMINSLTFDDNKAREELNWSPRSVSAQIPTLFSEK